MFKKLQPHEIETKATVKEVLIEVLTYPLKQALNDFENSHTCTLKVAE